MLVSATVAHMPHHSSLSVTVCEPTAMSEAGVREASSAGGLLESSCAVGDSSAWLDDAVLDAAKYVRKQVCPDTTVSTSLISILVAEEGSFLSL